MDEINVDFNSTKRCLNDVGCGFCLAKWTQVTIHLHNGRTASCHHTDPHKISIDEIKKNPSALHNTKYKKILRKEMLDGKRPAECDYCWNIEDNSNEYSDRIIKSSYNWSLPFYEDIKNSNYRDNFNPTYVEVIFSNTCNFKCSYCGPSFSSKWVEEINKYGEYPTSTKFNGLEYYKSSGRMPFNDEDFNTYVDAFWKWWPKLYDNLHTFRITGGEPLLSKDTWDVLDFIINNDNPNKNLNLAINTNLGVPDKLIDNLIIKINKLTNKEKLKTINLYTSIDGWGEQAEYSRFGLNFNKFWDNINKILYRCPTVTICIMSTYNSLSISSYKKLIDGIYDLKREYGSFFRNWTDSVILDTSYLTFPSHQTVRVLPIYFSDIIKYQGDYINSLPDILTKDNFGNDIKYGYAQTETTKIKRIYDWMISPQDEKKLIENRKDFYLFFNEYDIRRGTNFCKTFPELEDFYNYCKEIKN